MRKLKIGSILIFSPLMVYLLDLIYGLAKLDINDSANEFGYGWFYLFFFFNLNRFLNMTFLAFNAIMVVVFSSKIKNLTMMRVIHFLSTCYIFLLTFPSKNYFAIISSTQAYGTIRSFFVQVFLATLIVQLTSSIQLIGFRSDELADEETKYEKTKIVCYSFLAYLRPVLNIIIMLFRKY